MPIALALVLFAACSGTAGVRDHAEGLAAATHCATHACGATPQARGIGDGCYVVENRLYQCSTDELPHGEASCFEIPICSECEITITDGDGREIAIDQCRRRWWEDREAHRPPPTCSPVEVVAIGAALPAKALSLATATVLEVVRSGKDRVLYEAAACGTSEGVVVGDATRSSGFAALDDALHEHLTSVALRPRECVNVTLVASHFECVIE